jgi:lysophospholipase L1-like esterase
MGTHAVRALLWLWLVMACVAVEAMSWAFVRLSSAALGRPIPDRRRFLADQSRMLERLVNEPGIRARIHPQRGWDYPPGYASDTDHLSDQGLRALRVYDAHPPPGVTRIAAFGDSFVYCNEVVDRESWTSQLEAGWRAEVLNYGVGGYGADQALLRYQEEAKCLTPQVVIMGFTTLMAPRAVSRYRRFQDPRDGVWFKPRFTLDGDELRFMPSPVATRQDAERLIAAPALVTDFGRGDFWYNGAIFEHPVLSLSATYRLVAAVWVSAYRRYLHPDRIFRGAVLNTKSEAFRLLAAIFRDFARAVRANGALPVAVLLPTRSEVDMQADIGSTPYETFRQRLVELGLQFVDLAPALNASRPRMADLFAPGGHYSGAGNAIVAATLADVLGLAPRT